MSGTPDTTFVNYITGPTTPYGRGDLGRTSPYVQTDLRVSHCLQIQRKVSAETRS